MIRVSDEFETISLGSCRGDMWFLWCLHLSISSWAVTMCRPSIFIVLAYLVTSECRHVSDNGDVTDMVKNPVFVDLKNLPSDVIVKIANGGVNASVDVDVVTTPSDVSTVLPSETTQEVLVVLPTNETRDDKSLETSPVFVVYPERVRRVPHYHEKNVFKIIERNGQIVSVRITKRQHKGNIKTKSKIRYKEPKVEVDDLEVAESAIDPVVIAPPEPMLSEGEIKKEPSRRRLTSGEQRAVAHEDENIKIKEEFEKIRQLENLEVGGNVDINKENTRKEPSRRRPTSPSEPKPTVHDEENINIKEEFEKIRKTEIVEGADIKKENVSVTNKPAARRSDIVESESSTKKAPSFTRITKKQYRQNRFTTTPVPEHRKYRTNPHFGRATTQPTIKITKRPKSKYTYKPRPYRKMSQIIPDNNIGENTSG